MRNCRRYLLGSAISVIGTWMQRVAQDWLVLQLSHSPIALGISSAAQFAPVLVGGLWGGVLIDRARVRRLLVITQSVAAVLAAVLAVLTATGAVRLWMVYALGFALGIVSIFDNPGRQAFLTEILSGEDLLNGQALYSTLHNAGRLVGPTVAGLLIGWTSMSAVFAINAVSFLAVITSLLVLDPSAMHPAVPVSRAAGQLREGLRYVAHRRMLWATLLAVAVVGVFGQNFRVVLPLFAQQALHGDARSYGYLTSAMGLGAVVGALGSAGGSGVTLRLVVVSCGFFGLTNLAAAGAPSLPVALLTMVGLGIGNIVFNTAARTILLANAEPGVRGRVMSLHNVLFLGSTPVGGPLAGLLCAAYGVRAALLVAGGSALLVAVAVVAVAPPPRLSRVGARVRRRSQARQGDVPTAVSARVEEEASRG